MEHEAEGAVRRYLVIYNISKQNNIRALLHAAEAYRFQAIVVGACQTDLSDVKNYQALIKLETYTELVAFLKAENVPLVGIEIMDGAKSILENPFTSSIALMPGNEGSGLSLKQKEIADSFLYIPQYGFGTASLNVYIATTLVLHRYCLWEASIS